jgi:hypothetical protein
LNNRRSSDEARSLADKLGVLLLQDFLKLASEGGLTPTDRKTLYQMLKEGGFSLDPSRLPDDLRGMMLCDPTEDLKDEDEDNEDI